MLYVQAVEMYHTPGKESSIFHDFDALSLLLFRHIVCVCVFIEAYAQRPPTTHCFHVRPNY